VLFTPPVLAVQPNDITILSPGQATSSTLFDEVEESISQLERPDAPCGPSGPCGPCGPAGPCGPSGPAGP